MPFRGTLPPADGPRVLDVKNVSKRFGDKVILDDVTFHVPVGEFLCLCGPNGAGKSTLLKIILGLVEQDGGDIEIAGEPAERGRKKIGYVPQRKAFDRDFPATPVEVVVANLRGRWPLRITEAERKTAMEVLDKTGAKKIAHAQMRDLSGGETQRVFLARALVTHPALIILDEPTAGVDVKGRAELLDLMAEISRSDELAAILVTHNLAAVAHTAERIVYLEAGRLLGWGLPDELLGQASLTALAFAGTDHARARDEE